MRRDDLAGRFPILCRHTPQLPPTFLWRGLGSYQHVGAVAERVLARIEVIDDEGSEAA